MYECYIPESGVFKRVSEYLKSLYWDDVSITKNILDDGDVSFTLFLKSEGQTFLKINNSRQFEELIVASSSDIASVRVQNNDGFVSYIYTPVLEESKCR